MNHLFILFHALISLLLACNVFAQSHHPQAFLENIKHSNKRDQLIYEQFCETCHHEQAQISVGAPKPQSVADWKPRILKGKDVLFRHTDEGIGLMPPRGGCFECSDADLWAAILFMMPEELKVYIK